MTWKITLGKPQDTYIIGRRWIKKNIDKKNKMSKPFHREENCPGAIYDIGFHYLPDRPDERQHLWVCFETGNLLINPPKTTPKPEIKPKKVVQIGDVKKVQPIKNKKFKPVIKEPEPILESVAEPEVKKEKRILATKDTSISEIKGIGSAAYEKLTAAEIKTIGDLLNKHSQEIATLIGRKSDIQIKIWQETARSMIS